AVIIVHGVYKDRSNVEEIVRALKLEGLENADISVVVAENKDSRQAPHAEHTLVTESVVTGGGSGAVVGGALGGLAGISLLAIPFIGPFMAAGSMLAGAGVGGTVGTIVGALKGIGLPEDEAKRYEGHLTKGGLLVSVRCDSLERVKLAKDLLRKTGATDISSVGEGDAGVPGTEKTSRPTAPEGTLINSNDLHDFSIRAIDGEIGTVRGFYFDEDAWAIRYIAVTAGDWLDGRLVLISPISIVGQPDWQARRIDVSLTKMQVENSPFVDTLRPISRKLEMADLSYYGYPYYWGGSDLWGDVPYPADLAGRAVSVVETPRATTNPADSHLRSTEDVFGYGVEAPDGEVGHVDGFVIDDRTWVIRYIGVATRNWWPGKKVLVSPAWIDRLTWANETIDIEFSRETIRSGPEYTESAAVNREYENRLYSHYGRRPYWLGESKHRPSVSLSPIGSF
ncbi:MAG: PRC-barrel domain-containing protein, partial [Bryobacteraceae bacterium]